MKRTNLKMWYKKAKKLQKDTVVYIQQHTRSRWAPGERRLWWASIYASESERGLAASSQVCWEWSAARPGGRVRPKYLTRGGERRPGFPFVDLTSALQCTMWLSIALELSKVLKSKGLVWCLWNFKFATQANYLVLRKNIKITFFTGAMFKTFDDLFWG